ncbi:MAG: AlpA family phage regulatory protein [Deltaproteobacteria bacterium]|nr:AlpA family phage regulatory protein [Deltaproteobacteria bacterium]
MSSDIQELRLLRLREVLRLYPVSRSSWLEGVRLGRFPKPVRLSERCVAWRYSDIKALLESLAVPTE